MPLRELAPDRTAFVKVTVTGDRMRTGAWRSGEVVPRAAGPDVSGLLRQYLAGRVGGMDIGQGFLLGASVLMEMPIAMIVVSRLLERRTNRWANIAAGSVMTVVQSATLFAGSPTGYYVFFSVLEISCTALIVRFAWTWPAAEKAPVPDRAVPVSG